MLNRKQINKILAAIGHTDLTEADWAQIGMACIDQAMVTVRGQGKIKDILGEELQKRGHEYPE